MSEIKALEKLRNFVSKEFDEWRFDSLNEIADKIEAEIADRYMLLPADADGVPIHMGDAVEGELFFDNVTVRGTVCAYHIHDDDEPGTVYIRVKPTKDTWTIKELQFKRCRHVKPPTLEDVLIEYRLKVYNLYADQELTGEERVNEFMKLDAEYGSEIRELLLGGDAS